MGQIVVFAAVLVTLCLHNHWFDNMGTLQHMQSLHAVLIRSANHVLIAEKMTNNSTFYQNSLLPSVALSSLL